MSGGGPRLQGSTQDGDVQMTGTSQTSRTQLQLQSPSNVRKEPPNELSTRNIEERYVWVTIIENFFTEAHSLSQRVVACSMQKGIAAQSETPRGE
jgi:hypothetical protein